MRKHFALLTGLGFLLPSRVFATEAWTPLITADHFAGIKADTLLAVGGIIVIVLVVAGLGILIRVIR